MANLGVVIKDEIRRLARKETRAQVGPLRKRLTEVRQLAADLKRKVADLEAASARLTSEYNARMLESTRAPEKLVEGARLGARSIRSQRKRFGLTRVEFGRLVGVSANTVYLWESGKVTPRGKSRSALVGVRKVGAREAKRLLAAAGAGTRRGKRK